jgi:hypothetical protein
VAERHLPQADRHITEGEARVARQRALVGELAADGHDAAMAEGLLATMLASLARMREHRATILAEVAAERGESSLG